MGSVAGSRYGRGRGGGRGTLRKCSGKWLVGGGRGKEGKGQKADARRALLALLWRSEAGKATGVRGRTPVALQGLRAGMGPFLGVDGVLEWREIGGKRS